MAFKDVKAGVRNSGNLIKQAIDLSLNQNFSSLAGCESFGQAADQFDVIFGGEALGANSPFALGMKANLGNGGFEAAAAAIGRADVMHLVAHDYTPKIMEDLAKRNGLESFTMANFSGSSAETKATNIVLNTQTQLQTAAAEELYKTIKVKYEDEGIRMTVRAAGVGSYVTGANAWESMTELTPIFGILRTGDIFKDDVLRVWPVLSEDPDDENASLFVDAAVKPAKDQEYPATDAYGRQNHLTQMLAVPGSVPNLLGLCTAPGQRPWTDTDDLESASFRVMELGVTGKLAGVEFQAFITTESMTNINMVPTSVGQNSNDRDLDITLRHQTINSLVDEDGKPLDPAIFKEFTDKGYTPNLFIKFNARFNRQTNRLDMSSGKMTIESMTDAEGNRISGSGANAAQKALMRSLTDGSVNGMTPSVNLTNASNGNFGYRLEIFDTQKELTTRRQDPVSVKYPVRSQDVNKEALDDAVSYMGVTIKTNCSKKAFEAAYKHLDYITSIDGAPVVDNENGGNDLPGRMYVSASAVRRSFRIQDHVSSPDNLDVFNNICSLFLNEIQDITAALAFKSGLAAINEYSGIGKTKWSIIVHQNLHRFLMRSGDPRLTASEDFKMVETNFDSMIGKILIVPQNDSTEDRVNPLGGVGVNVAKENVVLHGNVTRGSQDFGVMMTMPCFLHWNLNVIVGSLIVEDALDFLGDTGVLSKLGGVIAKTAPGKALETTSTGGTPAPTGPAEVKIVNDATSPVFTQEVP